MCDKDGVCAAVPDDTVGGVCGMKMVSVRLLQVQTSLVKEMSDSSDLPAGFPSQIANIPDLTSQLLKVTFHYLCILQLFARHQ